jgi:hypothetical protein
VIKKEGVRKMIKRGETKRAKERKEKERVKKGKKIVIRSDILFSIFCLTIYWIISLCLLFFKGFITILQK